MAERNPITPRSSAYSAYVPEADPAWVRGQALIGKEKRAQDIYDYVLAKTGSQEQASRFTDQAMRTMDRQEITGAVTGAAPFLARGAEGTVNLASRVLGRGPVFTRPLEGQVLSPLLGGGRNARTPDEMLEIAAPPTRPAIGYQPRDTVGTPSRTRDMISEGGIDPEAALQARRIREGEAATNRALESTRFEGEGGTTADTVQMARDVHNRRVAQERAQREMELSRFEGEGGREGRSFSRDFTFEGPSYYNYPPPVRFNEAGVPVAGGRPVTNDMPLFTQGERSLETQGASSGPKDWSYKTYVHPSDLPPHPETDFSTWSFGRPESGPRAPIGSPGVPVSSPGAPVVGEALPAVVEGGASQGASKSTGSNFPLSRNEVLSSVGTGLAGGAGLVYFEPEIRSFIRSALTETPNPTSQPSQAPAITPADLFDMRAPAITPADLFDMRGNHPLPPPRPAGLGATPAPQRAAAPAPRSVVTTPPPAEGNDSILNRIFSGKDYQSARGQVEQATPEGRKAINWGDPESAADFFRADKAMRGAKERGEDFTGMATGGSAKPHKDASLHKALEIIHSLISSR